MNTLQKRVIDVSYKKKLSHIGSCVTAVPIIDHIYSIMNDNDIFVLSSGHAGLALYCVLEKYYGHDAEDLFDKHGVHPNRDVDNHITASGGSLGHGLGIAIGHAIVNRDKMVYVLVSDGECGEGSIWEALRFIDEYGIRNIRVFVNINGYGAYKDIDVDSLLFQLEQYDYFVEPVKTSMKKMGLKTLDGLSGHYHVLTDDEYKKL